MREAQALAKLSHPNVVSIFDQFSLCVTLFEALNGKRPFLGETAEDLKRVITTGSVVIPEDAKVPKWIEEIALKGLSVKKENRYQSIAQLLDALGIDPEIAKSQKRKMRFFVLASFFGALLFLGIGYVLFGRANELCTGAEKKLSTVWNADRKALIQQSFAKTGLSYADDTFVRVSKRLGDYLGKWNKPLCCMSTFQIGIVDTKTIV